LNAGQSENDAILLSEIVNSADDECIYIKKQQRAEPPCRTVRREYRIPDRTNQRGGDPEDEDLLIELQVHEKALSEKIRISGSSRRQ